MWTEDDGVGDENIELVVCFAVALAAEITSELSVASSGWKFHCL